MSEIGSKMRLVQMSNYVQPKVEESYSKEYVTYGDKNQYFQYLIDRSRGSATNGAVIKSIIDMIFGQGLNNEDFYNTIPEEDIRRLVNDIKRMGQCAIQVQYFGGRKSVKGSHIPIETLAAEKVDDKGNINAYYYARDWEKVRSIEDVERIPTFESKEKAGIEILYIKPYNSGLFYYSTVDYQGGLQYAELEEEVSNYHINNIQNGLAPSMLINMNNGIPETEEKAKQIEKRITDKYTGSSNAGRFVLMFNDNKESESTITPIPLSDASEQYQFLSDESSRKIMLSHRVTSPTLFGLSSSNGFSSNTDELKVSSMLFESMSIKPFRQLLINAFDKLNEYNKNNIDLEFISLNPFEDLKDKEADVEQTQKIKEKPDEEIALSSQVHDDVAKVLIDMADEDLEGWELIDERPVDYLMEDTLDENIKKLNNPNESLLSKIYNFVSTGIARPNAKSEQDGTNSKGTQFKVRYQYSPLKAGEDSREFCKAMVNAAKVYRKEDIIAMENKPVNKGWGLGGADTYSIWLYKGGGACHHKWYRKTYVRKDGEPKKRIQDQEASTTTAVRKQGFKPVANEQEVPVAPIDMPNKGFVNK